jgi:hypothetical protein
VQWAASISTASAENTGVIPVVLIPSLGVEGPTIVPTGAVLQPDLGPLDLTVRRASGDDDGERPGTTRLELGLPVIEPGAYRAEFLDLTDDSGTWRFRIGEFAINVLADAAPGDLEPMGGTAQTGGLDGGAVQTFEIRLRNATDRPIDLTGAATDVPGIPLTWFLAEQDPFRPVDHLAIPADTRATVTVGTEGTQKPPAFVLATPELTYRVGASLERSARFAPVEFQGGFGQPSDVTAYRATLPADACGQQR